MATKNECKIILNVLGQEWKSKGKDIDTALSNFDLEWQQIKGKGILKITQGKSNIEYWCNAIKLRRIFANKITRQLWAKRLEVLLKSDKTTNLPEKLIED